MASTLDLLRDIDFYYRRITNKKTETTFASVENLDLLERKHGDTNCWKYKNDLYRLEQVRKQLFTTDKRCLKITTINSFKGWESPCVILILENKLSSHELLYTAITRPREKLYVMNIGNDLYHNFFASQCY
jgi:superfamily I DNA/RNA helicase